MPTLRQTLLQIKISETKDSMGFKVILKQLEKTEMDKSGEYPLFYRSGADSERLRCSMEWHVEVGFEQSCIENNRVFLDILSLRRSWTKASRPASSSLESRLYSQAYFTALRIRITTLSLCRC